MVLYIYLLIGVLIQVNMGNIPLNTLYIELKARGGRTGNHLVFGSRLGGKRDCSTRFNLGFYCLQLAILLNASALHGPLQATKL